MKTTRPNPWLFAGFLLGAASQGSFAEELPRSSFGNWTGSVNTLELSDGSQLFEYTAQTFVADQSGAILNISFVPRFSCLPIISVGIESGAASGISSYNLDITIDEQRLTFGSVTDLEGARTLYTVASSSAESVAIREKLDESSTMSVQITPVLADQALTDVLNDRADVLVFSLIGSRLATEAAELACLRHYRTGKVRL